MMLAVACVHGDVEVDRVFLCGPAGISMYFIIIITILVVVDLE